MIRRAYMFTVTNKIGTVSEAIVPRSGSMRMRTITTSRNIPTLASVMGSIARIKRTWERSDEARDISCPVEV